ncbi:MAG: putative manganese-dependent inorganic diphosphatase [Oliverpabstia sp.]|nr:putative manganese-dependent inorganic diphosphatase [Eubacterium sp.]MCI6995906.1 putative manganese-dependent inorganic diphosphatase [Eubacterium sp.]MDY2595906.1 putative manganese-dependent inorganic diphosphatase [Oliverpabstia sp.]
MKKNNKVFIIGHKNPDTDSICSAIAYADIKNRTEKGTFVAKRAGQINEETEFVLKYFHKDAPGYLPDVGTQVKDMELHETPGAEKSMSVKRAWNLMKEYNAVTLPITTKSGELEGLITTGDIAMSYIDAYDNSILAKARTQYRSIADTLDGEVIVGNEHGYFIKGKVWIGGAHPETMESYIAEDDLVILGNRAEDHLCAIEANVSCLIVCLGGKVSQTIQRLAAERDVVIITTPYDTFTVARLIHQSIPIKYLMKNENLITFRNDDFTDKIKDIMTKNRYRAFPVVNTRGKYIGTVSRRNLLNIQKKKIILVDHNEKSQAVDNIDEAEIVEIIDHHRIGSLETFQPVMFRNQPVGCTATIMYQIYSEKYLDIPQDIAGLLCAAILSDTLMFRSPTCTEQDKEAAGELAKIAKIDIESFAGQMFRAGSNLSSKTPEEIFYQDYKKFIAGELVFGVGQISFMSEEELQTVKERLMPYVEKECGNHGVTMVFFMLTNIIKESTELICYGKGSDKLVYDAFQVEVKDESCRLEGVVSRKKQLIPRFMNALQQ